MQRLFLFIYQYRAVLTFLFLELICGWLIVQNNRYQGVKFFNSSSRVAAGLLGFSNDVSGYFELREINVALAEKNAALINQLIDARRQTGYIKDTTQHLLEGMQSIDTLSKDSIDHYDFISARVINNSVRNFNNHITINKGEADGVVAGMAVIDNNGIIGKVKTTSRHFAVITSFLHSNVMVSAQLKRTGDLCTAKWDGKSPYTTQLLYLPRHVQPMVGDTIVTSGYNAVFPEKMPIGVIEKVEIQEDALFYDIEVALSAKFNKLSFVYLVRNNMKSEQDSIQTKAGNYSNAQ